MKVNVDKNLIDELLTRGVEKIYPSREQLKEKLSKGEKIRLYCGFDPSANSLHIGHLIQINKLSQFQKLGHEVIFLIGDFTGMIGDPSDKTATRQKLTRKVVLENARDYQEQAESFLSFKGDNPAQVKYNSQWNDKLTFKEVIELSSNFTVQQMIQRDMFQKRLANEKPIHLHEFLYPLVQGYDSVAMDVDLEVGGNDQMFNMLAGRTLMKNLSGKEKFVMNMKLLADDSGKKMGKTDGNAIFLNQEAKDIYGIVMSWSDEMIVGGFELCTQVPMEEIKKIKRSLKSEETNPRDYKMQLALEITKIISDEVNANKAQENFVKTIQKKEIPDEIASIKLREDQSLLDVLVRAKLAQSKGDAKRKITQGGVTLKNEKICDINFKITCNLNGEVLKVGKRGFVRIEFLKK